MTTAEFIVTVVIGLVLAGIFILILNRFLPPMPDSGDRLIGPFPRDVWEPASVAATARGENLVDVIEQTLRAYAREAGQ